MNLGLAFASLEEYKHALLAFEIGIEIVPTDISFWERKGTVLLALGEKERAEHCLANAPAFAKTAALLILPESHRLFRVYGKGIHPLPLIC